MGSSGFCGLGVLWQQLREAPIRLTQANALFKRDQTRLRKTHLSGRPTRPSQLAEVPDAAMLVMAMGIATGLFVAEPGAIRADRSPVLGHRPAPATIPDIRSALPRSSELGPGPRLPPRRKRAEPFPIVATVAILLLRRATRCGLDAPWRTSARIYLFETPRLGRLA